MRRASALAAASIGLSARRLSASIANTASAHTAERVYVTISASVNRSATSSMGEGGSTPAADAAPANRHTVTDKSFFLIANTLSRLRAGLPGGARGGTRAAAPHPGRKGHLTYLTASPRMTVVTVLTMPRRFLLA